MKRDNIHHSDEIPAHPEKSTGIDQRNIASTNIEKNLYQSILDNQEDLIIRFFATGQINYVNQAFCAGVEKTRENLLGKNIFDVLKYPERSDVPDILRNLLRSPQRIVFDEEASFFGHEYCWIQWVATPLYDDQNQINEFQIVGKDITGLKLSEETERIHRDLALIFEKTDDRAVLNSSVFNILCTLSVFSFFAMYIYKKDEDVLQLQEIKSSEKEPTKFPDICKRNSPLGILLLSKEIQFFTPASWPFQSGSVTYPDQIQNLAKLPIFLGEEPCAVILLGTSYYNQAKDEIQQELNKISKQLESLYSQLKGKTDLNQREKEMRGLFQSIDEMLLVINEAGDILDVNRSLKGNFRALTNKKGKHTIFDLHPADCSEKIILAIQELKKDRHSCTQVPMMNTAGKQIDVEIDFTYGRWKGQEIIICFYKDVSQRVRLQEIERDQHEFSARLVDIAGIMNSSLDLNVVFDHIIDSLEMIVHTTACNLLLVDGTEGHVVRSRGYEQMGTAEIINSRIFELPKVKTYLTILETKRGLCIPDVRQYPDWKPMPESFWVRSYLSTPIIINDQIYGFINCDDRTANAFSENHANKVKLLADQAAIAIENAQVYSETRNRLKQIALINELTQSMLDSKQLDDILLTLAKRIMFIFDANSLLITKWDEENNLASLLTSYGDGLMPNIPKSNKVGEFSLTEEVIKQKHAIVVDAKGDYKTWSEELSKIFLDRVILALPMTTREKSLGAILIGFKNPKRITQAEISIGEYASLQIATILQKSNAFEKAQEQSAQFQHANDLIASLSIVATSILSTKGLEDIIKTMGEGLEKMNIHSSMFFNNSDPRTLQLDYCSRMTELKSLLKNLGHPSDKKLFIETPRTDQFHNTLYNQQIEFINDLAQLLKFSIPSKFGPFIGKFQEALDIGPDTKSLFMPLIVERKTIGLLGLYGRDLQEIDLKAGEIFNSQISVALENSRLLAEVQRLAVTDELTKINNRRGLFESGNRELLAAKRLNRSLSVLMIDLDIFKDVNDKYGHAVGDVTLSEVARRIAVNIREIDIVGRYGGEEFVALLPETDLPKALLVAERIRKAVADERILTEAGPIQVTVSIGIDELSIMTNSLEQLIKSADRALYIAKRNGRNQVATLSKIEKSHS